MSRSAEPDAIKQLCEHVAALLRDIADQHTRRMVFGLNAAAGDFVRRQVEALDRELAAGAATSDVLECLALRCVASIHGYLGDRPDGGGCVMVDFYQQIDRLAEIARQR